MKLNPSLVAVFMLCAASCQVNAQDCKSHIVARNQSGALKLGKIPTPPKGSSYSVWLGIYPEAIAVDSEHSVYVGDSVNYRVLKFDKAGKIVRHFKLRPPTRVKHPELSHIIDEMALDTHDNLYVDNALEERIEVYNKDGKFIRSIDYSGNSGSSLEHLSVNEEGGVELYSADKKITYLPNGSVTTIELTTEASKRKIETGRPYDYRISKGVLTIKGNSGKDIAQCTLWKINPVVKTSGNGIAKTIDSEGNFYTIDQDTLNVIKIVIPRA